MSLLSSAPLASAVVALLAALVAFGSFRVARASFNQGRTALATQVRKEWDALHADWTTVLALARGPSDYYSGATSEQRVAMRQMVGRFVHLATVESYSAAQHEAQSYSPSIVRTTGFLDLCSCLVLSNRLAVRDAYTVLGPEVARHGSSIRWALGIADHQWSPEDLPAGEEGDYVGWLATITDSSSYARQQRILALVDLLWAYAARIGDREAHVLLAAAVHKSASTSGARNRRRVRRLAHEWAGRRHSVRLQRSLIYAEFLPARAVHQDGKPIPGGIVDFRVIRMGWTWRLRALAAWLCSYTWESAGQELRKREEARRISGSPYT